MNYTSIQLNEDDALAFVSFQKHYSLVKLLESLGVFTIANGSCEIHFDAMGQIGSVDIRKHFRPKNMV